VYTYDIKNLLRIINIYKEKLTNRLQFDYNLIITNNLVSQIVVGDQGNLGLKGERTLLEGFTAETAVLAALLSRAAILGVVVVAGIASLIYLHHMPRPQQIGSY
jgi:hypothetical protein